MNIDKRINLKKRVELMSVYVENYISEEESDIGWYILEFLNTAREEYKIPVDNWIKLVKKYNLASRIVETFDCIQEMEPEDYALFLLEYLKNKGVNIDEYRK